MNSLYLLEYSVVCKSVRMYVWSGDRVAHSGGVPVIAITPNRFSARIWPMQASLPSFRVA